MDCNTVYVAIPNVILCEKDHGLLHCSCCHSKLGFKEKGLDCNTVYVAIPNVILCEKDHGLLNCSCCHAIPEVGLGRKAWIYNMVKAI